MTATHDPQSPLAWAAANHAYLHAELQQLRLVLHRRILWLRQHWQQDPLEPYKGQVISDAQVDWLLSGTDHHQAAQFYQTHPQVIALQQAIQDAEQQTQQCAQVLQSLGIPSALEGLVHLFGLTPFERGVLLLGLAADWDASFEWLYAYVQDDVHRKSPTPHLALTLLATEGISWLAARDSFSPEAPLRRFHLIQVAADLPATAVSSYPLQLDERIADYLRGVNYLDRRIQPLLQSLPVAPLAAVHQGLIDRFASQITQRLRQGQGLVNLTGAATTGLSIAQALCERLNLSLYQLDLVALSHAGGDESLLNLLSVLERESVLLQFAVYLEASEFEAVDASLRTRLRRELERLNLLQIIRYQDHPPSQSSALTVSIPQLDAQAQHTLWQQILQQMAPETDPATLTQSLEAIIQQFDLAPEAIAQVVTMAQTAAQLGASDSTILTATNLWQACQERTRWQLDELAQRIIPGYSWTDLVLPEDSQAQLTEIAAQVAQRFQVYERWGFKARLARGQSINALFAGASGTGKTMAAEVLANHLQLDLYRIDLAGVVSKYIGETEKNLRKVFDAAEQSGAILFFDEADALFGKRTEVKDSHDRYANIEINYLLQRMEDYRGLAILATNRKSDLDRAFLRRLRFLVDFPFPDLTQRKRIWQQVFPPQAPLATLDYDGLARLEITGGNIRNIALNAAFLAATTQTAIGMPHLLQAARREYAKIDKLVSPVEFGDYYSLVK